MAENQNAPAVFAKSLKKVFANNKNPALDSVALNGIDLVVPKGGLVSLMRRQGYNALRIGPIPDNRNGGIFMK